MKRTISVIAAVAALAVAAALAAGGAFSAFAHGERGQKMVERLTDELDLDREQRETLRAIVADFREFMAEQRRTRAAEMAAVLKKPEVTAAEIEAAMPDHDEFIGEVREFASAKIAEFHAELTPQQRARLADKINEFGIGGWGRHGWFHHGDGEWKRDDECCEGEGYRRGGDRQRGDGRRKQN